MNDSERNKPKTFSMPSFTIFLTHFEQFLNEDIRELFGFAGTVKSFITRAPIEISLNYKAAEKFSRFFPIQCKYNFPLFFKHLFETKQIEALSVYSKNRLT